MDSAAAAVARDLHGDVAIEEDPDGLGALDIAPEKDHIDAPTYAGRQWQKEKMMMNRASF